MAIPVVLYETKQAPLLISEQDGNIKALAQVQEKFGFELLQQGTWPTADRLLFLDYSEGAKIAWMTLGNGLSISGTALAVDTTWGDARYVPKSLFNAHTIIAATADDTPVALTVAEATILGRATGGNIAALTAAQVRDILAQTSNITVTVGSGGDFATLNLACAYLSKFKPAYLAGGYTKAISILTGHVVAEQLLVNGIDLGDITISSVDAEVTIDRSALTTAFLGSYPFIGVYNGIGPVINTLFTMDTSGTATNRHGILCSWNARIIVNAAKGVKNAGGSGVLSDLNASVTAISTDFSGAGINGLTAYRGGRISAESATITGCTTRGIYAIQNGHIDFQSGNAQKGGSPSSSDIVVARGGIINAGSATGGLSQTANTVAAAGIIFQ